MDAVYSLLIWTLAAKQPTEFGRYYTVTECLGAAMEADAKYEKAHSGETRPSGTTWVSIECRLGAVSKRKR